MKSRERERERDVSQCLGVLMPFIACSLFIVLDQNRNISLLSPSLKTELEKNKMIEVKVMRIIKQTQSFCPRFKPNSHGGASL